MRHVLHIILKLFLSIVVISIQLLNMLPPGTKCFLLNIKYLCEEENYFYGEFTGGKI